MSTTPNSPSPMRCAHASKPTCKELAMKLRTEMRGFADGTYYAAVKAGDTADAINHDAAAAHALMQAMREAGDGSADVAFYSDDDYQNWVYDRCDALLKQWGFDSGEDAR